MSVYSAIFENETYDRNGRPIRSTRGIPPNRYQGFEVPTNVQRTMSLGQVNVPSNVSQISSNSHHSNVFEVMSGRSNTIEVPLQPPHTHPVPGCSSMTNHLAPSNGTYVTYAQVDRPLPISHVSISQYIPMRTSSQDTIHTFVNHPTPIVPVSQMSRNVFAGNPSREIPWSQAAVSSNQVYSYNQTTPMNPYSENVYAYNGSREIPSSQATCTTNQVPMSTFLPISSVHGPQYDVFTPREIPRSQSSVQINSVPVNQTSYHENQWTHVPVKTDPKNNAQGQQSQHATTVYQSVLSGNSQPFSLTRSSSIGSVNSFTRNWVENLEPFNDEIQPNSNPRITQEIPQNYMLRDQVLSDAFRALTNRQAKDLPSFSGEIKEWPLDR